MKNYRFSWKLLTMVIVVIVVFTGLLYLESQQSCSGVLGQACSPAPPPGWENMAFNSLHVNSPTNVTLSLTNTGTATWALTEYFVKDSYGNTYSNTTWAGPTVSPQATTTVIILLSGKLTGQPFQIQSGHTYQITVVTARNKPFTYTFTA